MKSKHQRLYMDLACRIAKESYAKKLQVGCVIVKKDNVISMGWNGTPPGWDNDCEEDGKTRPQVYHSEENAILKLSRDKGGAHKAVIFITHTPCINCARMIFKSGITHVYYKDKYRDDAGLNFLTKAGIKIQQMKEK